MKNAMYFPVWGNYLCFVVLNAGRPWFLSAFQTKISTRIDFRGIKFCKIWFSPSQKQYRQNIIQYSIQYTGSFNNHVMHTTKWLSGPALSVRSFDRTDTARPPRLSITRRSFLEKSVGTKLEQRIKPIKFVI